LTHISSNYGVETYSGKLLLSDSSGKYTVETFSSEFLLTDGSG